MFDWMGKSMVLALQPSIAARLGLRSPRSWQQQLVLTDTSARSPSCFAVGMCARWETISMREPRFLKDVNWLMHPNVFEQMRRLGAIPPSIIRWVKRAQ